MDLHFSWAEIEKLLDEVRAAKTANTLYNKVTGKGLWLVGDHGVYLMANTKDGPRELARKKEDKAFIVYAKECDPEKLEFDEWWENKRHSFGGDDGVEFLSLKELESMVANPPQLNAKPHDLIIRFMPGKFSTNIRWKRTKVH